jgi:hypothetical protein
MLRCRLLVLLSSSCIVGCSGSDASLSTVGFVVLVVTGLTLSVKPLSAASSMSFFRKGVWFFDYLAGLQLAVLVSRLGYCEKTATNLPDFRLSGFRALFGPRDFWAPFSPARSPSRVEKARVL